MGRVSLRPRRQRVVRVDLVESDERGLGEWTLTCRRYCLALFSETLTEWDPKWFRLFVSDVSNDCTEKVLIEAFSKYKTFQKAKVIKDRLSNKVSLTPTLPVAFLARSLNLPVLPPSQPPSPPLSFPSPLPHLTPWPSSALRCASPTPAVQIRLPRLLGPRGLSARMEADGRKVRREPTDQALEGHHQRPER